MKIVIVLLLVVILYCLGSGVYFLIKQGEGSVSLVKALTWRIALSLLLFCLLMLAYFFGWITPAQVVP